MKKIWILLIVLLGSIGILFELIYDEFTTNPEIIFSSLRLFKYFTIQSNLIAVIYFFIMYFSKTFEKRILLKNYIGCIVVCITITFLMFAIFLEPIYSPQGLSFYGSLILHYVNPILIISYFLFFNRDYKEIMFSTIFIWLVYPAIYLIFLISHGFVTGDFLYPFFNITEIGILGLIISVLGLLGLFFMLSFVLVKIVSKK